MFRKGVHIIKSPGELFPDSHKTTSVKASSSAEINMKKGVWAGEPTFVIKGDYGESGTKSCADMFLRRVWSKKLADML